MAVSFIGGGNQSTGENYRANKRYPNKCVRHVSGITFMISLDSEEFNENAITSSILFLNRGK
jgi:hypothetical protein